MFYTLTDFLNGGETVDMVFPFQILCNATRYGITGGDEKLNALCLLNQNKLNGPLFGYVFTWLLVFNAYMLFFLVFRCLTLCTCVEIQLIEFYVSKPLPILHHSYFKSLKCIEPVSCKKWLKKSQPKN